MATTATQAQPENAPQPDAGMLAHLEPNERGIRKMLFDHSVQAQVFASLPPDIAPDKFAALCLDQLQAMLAMLDSAKQAKVFRNPVLVLRAAQRTAALGLIPGKGSGEVAWIFREGWTQKNGERTPDSIDAMPMRAAFQRLMRQADGVLDVEAVLVHERDTFRYRDGVVQHEFDPFDPEREFLNPDDAGDKPHGLRGGYLRVTYRDGRVRFHLVPFAKINANRRCSKKPNGDAPWGRWYPESVEKTIVRDAAARRVVDWSVNALERMAALEAAARDADSESPERGGYVDTTAEHRRQPAALTHAPAAVVPITGIARLKAHVQQPAGGAQTPATQQPSPQPENAAQAQPSRSDDASSDEPEDGIDWDGVKRQVDGIDRGDV